MGKYDSYNKDSVIIFNLLWSVHRIYYTALKMSKIYDSTAVDSSDDDDEMDY